MKIVERAEVQPSAWDEFVGQHPGGWWWHAAPWIDYSVAYTPGATDRSFAVVEGASLVAVVPLVVGPEQALVHGGQVNPGGLIQPMYDDAPRVAMFMEEESVARLGRKLEAIQLQLGAKPSMAAPPGHYVERGETYVVDLQEPEKERWRKVRKSYHSLIHRAQEKYVLATYNKPWVVQVAAGLHEKAAGRKTRSAETWRLMEEWTERGYALVALATDKDPKASPRHLGFAYAIGWKGRAYYASGATVVDDLAAALQWELMHAMVAGGKTRFYELGYAAAEGANEKERNIAKFKGGMGGKAWARYVLHVKGETDGEG